MVTKQQGNVDSLRMLTIMNDLKLRLGQLSIVNQQVLEGLETEDAAETKAKLEDAHGQEFLAKFEEQLRLEKDFQSRVEQIRSERDPGDILGGDIDIPIPKEIEKNTRELLKDINKMNFDVVAEFRIFQQGKNTDSQKSYKEFLDVLRNMTEVTDKILQTRVEEDEARAKQLEMLAEREAAAAQRKTLLETQLASNKRDHDSVNRSNQEIITKLVAELHDAAQNQQSKNQELEENTQRKRADMAQEHAATAKSLTEQTTALTAKLEKLQQTNKEGVESLEKQANRRHQDVAAAIQAYDDEIGRLTREIEQTKIDLANDQLALTELEDHFAKVNAEAQRKKNEDMINQMREKKKRDVQDELDKWANRIQAVWFGICHREEYAKDKKKAKKAKGKAGKAKKK